MADVEKQRKVFREMVSLADSLALPLVIHTRNNPNQNEVPVNAIDEALSLIGERRFVLHFFSGTAEQAERAVAMGGFISLTHIRSKEKRKIIEKVPAERLFVESDAPYIGRTPDSIREAIAYIAEVKNMDNTEVGKITASNAMRFFGFSV